MGFIQSTTKLVQSKWFNNLSTAVIVVYAAFVGFRTFPELSQPLGTLLAVVDWVVTAFFLLEIVVKMIGLGGFGKFFKDGWNVFDFVIVVLSLIPFDLIFHSAGTSEIVLVSRILRVFRVLRLFNARPELKKILNTVFKAFPAIVDVALLLFIIIYVYAVVGSLLFHEIDPVKWDNLLQSALTLFSILTFEGWVDVMEKTMAVYPWAWAYFLSFIVFGVFIAFNLFIAILNDRIQGYKEDGEEKGPDAKAGTDGASGSSEGSGIQPGAAGLEPGVAELKAKIESLERKIDKLLAGK